MKVTQYSTNDYGEYTSYELKPALYMGGAHTAKKTDIGNYSGFWGFGVAITGSSCYNLWQMEKSERRAFLESIYSKDGLGLKVARLTIGASDYSAELYSYDDVDGDVELKHFSIARDEEYIIPVIKEILEIAPNLKIFASPWSPPAWMKTNGSMCGGYMREKYIECYAKYIVKFIQAYGSHGIKVSAVTLQNEPESQQSGYMPACIWHPDIEAKFVSTLRKEMNESGLDTEIWIYDHNFSGADRVSWCLEEYPSLKDECNGIAFHYYKGSIEDTVFLKSKYPTLALHFTEGGPRLYDNYDKDWCKWAIMMSKALNAGYSSFTGWNLMLDETGGPNIGPFFCGGLVTRNRLNGNLAYSGQYKAFKHFTSYVNESSSIYPLEFTLSNQIMADYPKKDMPVFGTAIENKDTADALILINSNSVKAQVQYFKGGAWWYIELLPNTATTVIFEK